jgi:predicted PhzF superfamily epimerase YddE/YHI9
MVKAELIKAFTNNPAQGNPAGVIFDADSLSKEEMIAIASEIGYSELVSGDQIIVEQGSELGKEGQIVVQIKDGSVYVGGNAIEFGTKLIA